MMKKLLLAAAAMGIVTGTASLHAATITFSDSYMGAATDVSADGTLVAALNLGEAADKTVNTVLFSGSSSADVSLTNFDSAYADGSIFDDSPSFGTDGNALMDSFVYDTGSDDPGIVTFNNLSVNTQYLLQLFLVDDRTGLGQPVDTRTIDIVNGIASSPLSPGTGEIDDADFTSVSAQGPLLVEGTFTADASSQSLTLEIYQSGGDTGYWGSQLNALQLREVIPEPASFALLLLGGVAVLTRRRARRRIN